MFNYKITIIGDSAIGKTSLLYRLINKSFKNTVSTIGASFFTYNYYHDDHKITLQLWDTAGQERYRSLIPMYVRNSQGILYTFDLSNIDSLDSLLNYWIPLINIDCAIFFIGTKYDLVNLSETDIKKINKKISNVVGNNFKLFITSSFTGYGIDNAFNTIAISLYDSNIEPLYTSNIIEKQIVEKKCCYN